MAGQSLMFAMAVVFLGCSASCASVPEQDEDIVERGGKRKWTQLFTKLDAMEKKQNDMEAKLAEVYKILDGSRETCPQVPGMENTQLPNNRLPALGVKENIMVACQPGYQTDDGLPGYNAHCGEKGQWNKTDSCLKQRVCNQNVTHLSDTDKGYILFKEEKTFEEAKVACSADGGELAYPVTPNVLWHLVGLSNDMGRKDTYVGIERPAGSKHYSYLDGSKAENIPWCLQEPTNYPDEDCVEFFRGSKCLNNIPCDLKRRFLCQYECEYKETGATPSTLNKNHHHNH